MSRSAGKQTLINHRMELPNRVIGALQWNGVYTMHQLEGLTLRQLRRLPRIGYKSYKAILREVARTHPHWP